MVNSILSSKLLIRLDQARPGYVLSLTAVSWRCCHSSILSSQILSLQADEMQKESQVEEYERELARARWRLKKLREEVRQAKRKVEEAGERDVPLQDSIRQSYEEILQVPESPKPEPLTCVGLCPLRSKRQSFDWVLIPNSHWTWQAQSGGRAPIHCGHVSMAYEWTDIETRPFKKC